MAGHRKQSFMAHRHGLLSERRLGQLMRLDVLQARMYRDDADICSGAWSAPRGHLRPGQRDDAVCTLMPVLPVL